MILFTENIVVELNSPTFSVTHHLQNCPLSAMCYSDEKRYNNFYITELLTKIMTNYEMLGREEALNK